jgi:hypothetical protein
MQLRSFAAYPGRSVEGKRPLEVSKLESGGNIKWILEGMFLILLI